MSALKNVVSYAISELLAFKPEALRDMGLDVVLEQLLAAESAAKNRWSHANIEAEARKLATTYINGSPNVVLDAIGDLPPVVGAYVGAFIAQTCADDEARDRWFRVLAIRADGLHG